jgi:hypothetical protein
LASQNKQHAVTVILVGGGVNNLKNPARVKDNQNHSKNALLL